MSKFVAAIVHLLFFALVVAIGAYWAVRILTPQPTAAPPPMAAPPPRDPSPVAAARMFGLVQMAVAAVSNIQVSGVFAAGRQSAAILVIDGKPPRAYVLGQEVAAGTKLVDVRADGVTLEGAAGRQELRAPSRPVSAPLPSSAPAAPPPAFTRQGDTLSANLSSAGSSSALGRSAAPIMPPKQPEPQDAPGQQPQNTPPVTQ